jgi:hypothetical protein
MSAIYQISVLKLPGSIPLQLSIGNPNNFRPAFQERCDLNYLVPLHRSIHVFATQFYHRERRLPLGNRLNPNGLER